MPVHEDEHTRESVRRAPEHGTGDHVVRAIAQESRGANPAYARTKQITATFQRPTAVSSFRALRLRSGHAPSRTNDEARRNDETRSLPGYEGGCHGTHPTGVNKRDRDLCPESFRVRVFSCVWWEITCSCEISSSTT